MLYPIEVKLGATPKQDWLSAFQSLSMLKKKVSFGAVISLAASNIPMSKTVWALNAGIF